MNQRQFDRDDLEDDRNPDIDYGDFQDNPIRKLFDNPRGRYEKSHLERYIHSDPALERAMEEDL